MTDPANLAVATSLARIELQAAAMRASLATFYVDDSHADVDAHAEYDRETTR